jgi:hypothetical protein
MIDKVKWYFINIGLQKYLPIGVMSAVGFLGTFMMAHAGMLEQYGITYGIWPLQWNPGQTPSGACILIELDTLSASAVTLIVGVVTVAIRAAQHHSSGTPIQKQEEVKA